MLTPLFILFILCCSAYLLLSPRKEVPLVIILHALFQYGMTLALWIFHMNTHLVSLLLGFMTLSTGLLLWGRSLNYSREHQSITAFLSIGQWVLLGIVVLFISIKSPYYYLVPSSSWHEHINPNMMSIHPLVKVSGNIFLFTAFFHVVLLWGKKWSFRQSLAALGPIFIYFLLIVFLRLFQTSNFSYPFT